MPMIYFLNPRARAGACKRLNTEPFVSNQ